LLGLAGGLLFIYFFFCYCCLLICRKTGNEPGLLIWIPVLQLIPLLRSAGMSPVWFLAFLVPVLNIVVQVLWSFKIVQARGKNGWLALFLILPITGFFAFLFLAFSAAPQAEKSARGPMIMTLETS
jgi:hypothetical protein